MIGVFIFSDRTSKCDWTLQLFSALWNILASFSSVSFCFVSQKLISTATSTVSNRWAALMKNRSESASDCAESTRGCQTVWWSCSIQSCYSGKRRWWRLELLGDVDVFIKRGLLESSLKQLNHFWQILLISYQLKLKHASHKPDDNLSLCSGLPENQGRSCSGPEGGAAEAEPERLHVNTSTWMNRVHVTSFLNKSQTSFWGSMLLRYICTQDDGWHQDNVRAHQLCRGAGIWCSTLQFRFQNKGSTWRVIIP